jgi:putative transposase
MTEGQGMLAEAGKTVPDLCREHGISNATFYKWRARYGGMDASLRGRLKELEEENRRLKKLYVEAQIKADIGGKEVQFAPCAQSVRNCPSPVSSNQAELLRRGPRAERQFGLVLIRGRLLQVREDLRDQHYPCGAVPAGWTWIRGHRESPGSSGPGCAAPTWKWSQRRGAGARVTG